MAAVQVSHFPHYLIQGKLSVCTRNCKRFVATFALFDSHIYTKLNLSYCSTFIISPSRWPLFISPQFISSLHILFKASARTLKNNALRVGTATLQRCTRATAWSPTAVRADSRSPRHRPSY
jgi:hypothetical protein